MKTLRLDEFDKTIGHQGVVGLTLTRNRRSWSASVRIHGGYIGIGERDSPAEAMLDAVGDARSQKEG